MHHHGLDHALGIDELGVDLQVSGSLIDGSKRHIEGADATGERPANFVGGNQEAIGSTEPSLATATPTGIAGSMHLA